MEMSVREAFHQPFPFRLGIAMALILHRRDCDS
jgi:hypothetical protein